MKVVIAILLVTLALGNGLKIVDTLEKEDDRRELLIATSALVAACISGIVGAIVGTGMTLGVNSCIGPRERTVVIIRQENGDYRQQERRSLVSNAPSAPITNQHGVTWAGPNTAAGTCPANGLMIGLQKNSDGTFTLPDQFWSPIMAEKFKALTADRQAIFRGLTPKSFQATLPTPNVVSTDTKVQKAVANSIGESSGKVGYLEAGSPNVVSTDTKVQKAVANSIGESSALQKFLPHMFVGATLLLLGGLASYRKRTDDQKNFVYEELLDEDAL